MAKILDLGPAILTCCSQATVETVTKCKKKTIMEFLQEELYLGFSTTEPNTDLSNFTEPPAETGYQRQKWNDKRFEGWGNVGIVSNGTAIMFSEGKAGGYGTIAFLGIFDSTTSKKPVIAIRLDYPVFAQEGVAVFCKPGQLSFPVPLLPSFGYLVDASVISDAVSLKEE